ncbi:hypothetical protein PA10_00083 [Pseudomonas phage pPa_SNUABM_DT01]|nr:hypothetical protein PA10_00083 [Pseudomonas phage pPa_SNUABM_DT01]
MTEGGYAVHDKRILEDLKQALRNWCNIFFADPITAALGVKEHIVNNDLPELRRIRWYATSDEMAAEKLWLRYIDNQELEANSELRNTVFDFYMSGATYIWLHTPVASGHLDQFIGHLTQSLTWAKSCKFVPEAAREYMSTPEEMKTFLKGNHWAVFMVLLSMSELSLQ